MNHGGGRAVRGARPSGGRFAVLWVLGLVPALLTVPVLTLPAPTARPVPPRLQTIPLAAGTVLASQVPRSDRLAWVPGPGLRAAARTSTEPTLQTGQLATNDYDLLGLSWDQPTTPAGMTVAVRTRTADRWTDWHELHADSEDGPDHPEGRGGTAPYFAGRSNGVQVRVDTRTGRLPAGLRVDLIDAGSSPADAQVGAEVGAPIRLAGSSAHAAVTSPLVVSRKSWGADERIRECCPRFNDTVKVVFVHHTDSANDYRPDQSAAMVRGIYAFHVRSRGWSDIGYNALVDRYGRVFEGRAGGLSKAVQGAHTGGFNDDSFGVAVLGSLNGRTPTGSTLDALTEVVAWQLSRYHRNPKGKEQLTSVGGGTARYPAGRKVRFNVISGHRDAGSTDCPGHRLYALLPQLRERVSGAMKAGLIDLDVTMRGSRLAVQFRSLRELSYSVSVRPACGGQSQVVRRGRVDRLAPVVAAANVAELLPGRRCEGRVIVTIRTGSGGSGGSAGGKFVFTRTIG